MLSFQIVLLIIVGVTTGNAYENCLYFDNGSGFVKLPPLISNEKPVKISMDVKAYNCDDISIAMLIGNKYKFKTPVQGSFVKIFRNVDDYGIDSPCNGLWHNMTLALYDKGPLLHWNDETLYRDAEEYNIDELRGEPIYIGFHYYNETDDENTKFRTFDKPDKPFEGSIRKITIDGVAVVKSMDRWQINGTLLSDACPNAVVMKSTEGAVKLNEDVALDSENLQISFELKISNCPECCSNSAIILSAFGDDSYFILEIVKNVLYWKYKSGTDSSYPLPVLIRRL